MLTARNTLTYAGLAVVAALILSPGAASAMGTNAGLPVLVFPEPVSDIRAQGDCVPVLSARN